MHTFTITIGLVDDYGNSYDATKLFNWFRYTSNDTCFSFAEGVGVDTDTNEEEPIAIIQGFSDDLDSTYYGAMYMAESMNQRAICWFDSKSGGDSYARVMEDPLAYINPDA